MMCPTCEGACYVVRNGEMDACSECAARAEMEYRLAKLELERLANGGAQQ